MKKILFFSLVLVSISSCVNQRQRSNIIGRTDEVYFTPSDTRKKAEYNYSSQQNSTQSNGNGINQGNAGNYTSSYSNRLCYFGSRNRFSYNNYQPVLVPSLMYSNQTGWSYGLSYGYPMFGYGRSYYSPFSPYYGCYMPFNDPFYSYGWGGGWMTSYYPYYTYNPYMYSYNPYLGYGYYGNYGNYNPYFNYKNKSNTNYNYGRRNYSSSPNTQTNSNQNNNQNNNWYNSNTNTNSGNNSGNNSGSGKWWNSGSSSSGSGSTSGGGSTGGSGRSTSGNTGGSTRRR